MSYSPLLCIPVPFKTHMGPTWACLRITHVYCAHQAHLKPIWVPHGHAHVLPMFVVPTKPIYNPYGSHMGMPMSHPCLLCPPNPSKTHMGPTWACPCHTHVYMCPPSPPKTHMGPTWVCPCLTHVYCAHQTHLKPIWDPHGHAYIHPTYRVAHVAPMFSPPCKSTATMLENIFMHRNYHICPPTWSG